MNVMLIIIPVSVYYTYWMMSVYDACVQAALTLFGMISGPILGLFILGVVYPWTNYKVR